jgi:hypothetical protein
MFLLLFCAEIVPSPPATGLTTRAPGHLAGRGLATISPAPWAAIQFVAARQKSGPSKGRLIRGKRSARSLPLRVTKRTLQPAPVGQDPEAIVFDLVNPARARRRRAGRSRQAWLEGLKGLLRAQPAPELACGGRHRTKHMPRGGRVES